MVECRSEEGITIGLIDTILLCASVLGSRELNTPEIQEALRDLHCSPELFALLHKAEEVYNDNGNIYQIIVGQNVTEGS